MVLEFLISTSKLTIIFICIGLFVLSLVFKIMSNSIYYYYDRDNDFVNMFTAYKDSITVSKKFNPILKNIKIIPLHDRVFVSSSFLKSTNFKRLLPDGKFKYGIFEE
ncbi:MAG: hypothetical protein NTY22_00595 [Proteobacteria bacterium]|nr:hypothetical protein [Pseudomonadota bacterium]